MGKTKKPSLLSQQNYYFVAETGEISNLKLVEDISRIIEFIDNEVSGKVLIVNYD